MSLSPLPYTVYNMTICIPFSLCLAIQLSLLLSPWSLLGVTICLCVLPETFEHLRFGRGRGVLLLYFVLFCLFCKAYDSYCIRASSNNKNSESYCNLWVLSIAVSYCSNVNLPTGGGRIKLTWFPLQFF